MTAISCETADEFHHSPRAAIQLDTIVARSLLLPVLKVLKISSPRSLQDSDTHLVHGNKTREDDGTVLRGALHNARCGCYCARPATAVDSTSDRATLRSDAELPGTRSVAANHR